MKLYHVHSTVEEFHGHKDVCLTWFMWHREHPVLPYAEAIQGYVALNDEQRLYAHGFLDEHFTETEAQQVLAWLNENRQAKHEIIECHSTPIPARSADGAWFMGLGAIPVGGPQDFLMPNDDDWTLPFRAAGYYDLRFCERIAGNAAAE